jgi:hypothetical protein
MSFRDVQMESYKSQKFIEYLGKSLSNSLQNQQFLDLLNNHSSMDIGTPSRDLQYFTLLQDQFCKNFSCCGVQLQDMHELLQHFEETHVIMESDEEDDLPFQFESMEYEKPVCPSDIYQNDYAAFDTFSLKRTQSRNSPPNVWKQTTDSPPQTFPLVMDGPTQYVRNGEEITDSMEVEEEVPVKDDRPYKCKVQGCNKAYKNPGGLKYHMQHGHCEDTGDPEMNNIIHKPYQCTVSDCQKRYKNLNGLKVLVY